MNVGAHLLPAGTRLNNLYEIEEHIADGGIGTVYKARDVESGDPVAVKVLLATFSRDPMILDLFKREAKILRKLKHDALTSTTCSRRNLRSGLLPGDGVRQWPVIEHTP